jgi:hypothetical protein
MPKIDISDAPSHGPNGGPLLGDQRLYSFCGLIQLKSVLGGRQNERRLKGAFGEASPLPARPGGWTDG